MQFGPYLGTLFLRLFDGLPYAWLRPAFSFSPWFLASAGAAVLLVLGASLTGSLLYWRTRRSTSSLVRQLAQESAARQAAESANRVKAEFLAHMSHEIRTPMNAIFGFTDLALKSDLSPELRDYLDTVRTSADWLMHIVNDVLDFSRIEAGQLRLDPAPFALAECVHSAIKIIQPEAGAKNLSLRTRIHPCVPSHLYGDATRLRQVLFNLLENAVQSTTCGGVVLTVTVDSKSDSSVTLRVRISDTGVGMHPDQRQSIFEPFHSPANAPSDKFGSAGLGLAIAHRVVSLMDGAIEVQSQLGAGTTFEFTACFGKAESPAASSPSDVCASPGPSSRHLSILVAEDNAVNRRLITKLLESAGHHVTPASTGCEAVDLFTTEIFDLVLMDIEMPLMDGLETTRQIRLSEAGANHVPVYALTAHATAADRDRCLAAGMDGFISKPIDVNHLLEIVSGYALAPRLPEPEYAA